MRQLRPITVFFPVNSSAVDGYKFADSSIVADDHLRVFTLELQILGNSSDNSTGENATILTNSCTLHNGDIRPDPGSIADLNILVNDCERINFYIGRQTRVWVNISVAMNHLIKASPGSAGRGVAKVIVNAKQRIFFKTVIFSVELWSSLDLC